jgi:hypothetical protein
LDELTSESVIVPHHIEISPKNKDSVIVIVDEPICMELEKQQQDKNESIEETNSKNSVSNCMPQNIDPTDIIDPIDVETICGCDETKTILNVSNVDSPTTTTTTTTSTSTTTTTTTTATTTQTPILGTLLEEEDAAQADDPQEPIEENDDDDSRTTTTGSRSPTPVQFEITSKGVKVISDKESFL